MATFKPIPQTFSIRKILEYWYNMACNLTEVVRDNDFFDPIALNIDQEQVAALIQAAYTDKELQEMTEDRPRRYRLDFTDSVQEMLACLWNASSSHDKCLLVLKAARNIVLAGLARRRKKKEDLEARIDELQRVLKLSDVEREILTFSYLKMETCLSYPRRVDTAEVPMYFAMALNRSYSEIMNTLEPTGRLRKFNVLDEDWDFSRAYGGFMNGAEKEAVERRFYRKADSKEVLPWSFYGALAERHGTMLKRMLEANRGKGPLNILFYGAPGTGKSSFARTLAAEMGLVPFEICQGDSNGRNMLAESRMIGIQLCNEQVDTADSLMIVDEADELLRDSDGAVFALFGKGGGKSTEKGVVNSILDDMRVPAIWISNTPSYRIDESVRRRFDYSICFEKLSTMQREAIWRNVVGKLELGELIGDSDIPSLAAKYITSAGGISLVLGNVKKLNPEKKDVAKTIAVLMKQHCQLMGTDAHGKFALAKDYSLQGLNIKGKVTPEQIAVSVENYLAGNNEDDSPDRPRMNLLLWGPPGSGKTEFVKFLGERTGHRVIVKMGSDILDKYVGQSEQNIRDAFREAEAEKAILFFDEIDGLLRDRAGANHSWEVTQVNELMQQMENFDGVMVAATNFFKSLDPAVMRRFTFKLQFDFLDDAGKLHFFEHMFRTKLSGEEAEELKKIPLLCPGDFRTVRQSLYYLGTAVSNADRLAALREESALKPKEYAGGISIGF